jgi:hypothetical protein
VGPAPGPSPEGGIALAPGLAVPGTPPPAAGRGFQLRSDEVEEVIGYVPGRLVRWGTGAASLVAAGMCVLAFVVHYPEVVHGRATVTTPDPPVRVVAPAGGEVQRLAVSDGDAVPADAYLAVLRSAADYRDVARVQAALDAMQPAVSGGAVPDGVSLPLNPVLGDAQSAYTALTQAAAAYRAFAGDGLYAARAAALDREANGYRAMRSALAARVRLLESGRALGLRERDRGRTLAAARVLSPADAERAEAEYVQTAQALEAGRGEAAANEVRIAQAERAALELRQARADEDVRLRLAVRAAYDGLRQALRAWEQRYVLRAPVAGRVSFFRPLQAGRYLAAAEPVLAVVPGGRRPAATVVLSAADAGRVRAGQRVVLRFDAYPADTYGTVEGRVERISLVPDRLDGGEDHAPAYLVSVSLPRGLAASGGRALDFRQEMQARADIVTGDLRVADRLLARLRPTSARGN